MLDFQVAVHIADSLVQVGVAIQQLTQPAVRHRACRARVREGGVIGSTHSACKTIEGRAVQCSIKHQPVILYSPGCRVNKQEQHHVKTTDLHRPFICLCSKQHAAQPLPAARTHGACQRLSEQQALRLSPRHVTGTDAQQLRPKIAPLPW